MKELIFIDSSAFLALNDHKDLYHDQVMAWVKRMLSETVGLCTTIQAIGEAATQLKKRDFSIAKRFLSLMREPGIQLLEDNSEIQEKAWKLFLESAKNQASFIDCTKVACMHYYGIMKMLTFRDYFDQMQVVRVPKK